MGVLGKETRRRASNGEGVLFGMRAEELVNGLLARLARPRCKEKASGLFQKREGPYEVKGSTRL